MKKFGRFQGYLFLRPSFTTKWKISTPTVQFHIHFIVNESHWQANFWKSRSCILQTQRLLAFLKIAQLPVVESFFPKVTRSFPATSGLRVDGSLSIMSFLQCIKSKKDSIIIPFITQQRRTWDPLNIYDGTFCQNN